MWAARSKKDDGREALHERAYRRAFTRDCLNTGMPKRKSPSLSSLNRVGRRQDYVETEQGAFTEFIIISLPRDTTVPLQAGTRNDRQWHFATILERPLAVAVGVAADSPKRANVANDRSGDHLPRLRVRRGRLVLRISRKMSNIAQRQGDSGRI
jgi:hypothetical protein